MKINLILLVKSLSIYNPVYFTFKEIMYSNKKNKK